MTGPQFQPKYRARRADTARDLDECLALRAAVFRPGCAQADRDRYDEACEHICIERHEDGVLVGCFRYALIRSGSDISGSYAAQFYDLSPLQDFQGAMIELGRFCVAPNVGEADVLRVAWGALAEVVEAENVELMFGCSSFQGVDKSKYYDAFAMLRDRHLGPALWRPKVKAPKVFEFAKRLRRKADPKIALRAMPPLLKTYLAMGGWVSDHAVIDRDLNTLHVFTGVEVAAIPPARKRSIKAAMAR